MTMMPRYEAEQLRAFSAIIKNGHLYKGFKPVHWCLNCRSSLAEAEVEYEDKKSPSIYVRFDFLDASDLARRFSLGAPSTPVAIAIWTTTPWTLPANCAVAVHPEFDYSWIEFAGANGVESLVLASELVDKVMAVIGVSEFTTLARAKGASLKD